MGEFTDLGNNFWQAHFGKNRKTHLSRGFNKPSSEVHFFVFAEMRLPKSVTQVRGFTPYHKWLPCECWRVRYFPRLQNECSKYVEWPVHLHCIFLITVSKTFHALEALLVSLQQRWVNPRTWVTLFSKRISAKTEKRTSVEGLLSPQPRS